MNTYFVFALTTFTGFFAIMNPLANTPIFMGLTEDDDLQTKKLIALKALIIAFAIIFVFTVAGRFIFELFSISLPAFRITGGILVCLTALSGCGALRGTFLATDEAGSEIGTPIGLRIEGNRNIARHRLVRLIEDRIYDLSSTPDSQAILEDIRFDVEDFYRGRGTRTSRWPLESSPSRTAPTYA